MSKGVIFRCQSESGSWYLSYQPYESVSLILTSETLLQQATVEELADLCDQTAEQYNNHSFVGIHRITAALLYQHLGREQATRMMFEIAARGGLDGMCGAGGKASSFAEFGLPDDWSDWTLPELK